MINARARLRDMRTFTAAVSSVRNVALIPEVQSALLSWLAATVPAERGVLIGGLAMSFYAAPRATTDVDLLYLSSSAVPMAVEGFKRHRKGVFQDKATHVEIEVTDPASVKLPLAVVRRVIETAITIDKIKVASLEGLIALKLYGALTASRKFKDLGDVQRLVQQHPYVVVDAAEWCLTPQQQAWLTEIKLSN